MNSEPTSDRYDDYVEHPRYGRGPVFTGLWPSPAQQPRFHDHSPPECRIPRTAIVADPARQQPDNCGITHYCDVRRVCRVCGRRFIFHALEQRHWYEELGFPLYANCVECPLCRKHRQKREVKRRRYEELCHVGEPTPAERLEMIDCALSVFEEHMPFTDRLAERIRIMLKRLPDAARADPAYGECARRYEVLMTMYKVAKQRLALR